MVTVALTPRLAVAEAADTDVAAAKRRATPAVAPAIPRNMFARIVPISLKANRPFAPLDV